ncbi:MAG: hypothetical protein IT363_02355 [Methanoregulaceae archaeon]|nr:hypothetical protein [Methanoregulaceae archaeon]
MPNLYSRSWPVLAAIALGASLATAQDTKSTEIKPATKDNKTRVAKAMAPRLAEVTKLRERANAVTSKIGDLASSGKLNTNDETVAALKELVQELGQINEQLKKMQDEIEDIKGWIEGQNENLPIIAQDISDLKKYKNGSYLQVQYSDAQNNAGTPRPNDGFNMRRTRFSHTGTIDSRTSYKMAVDFSSGSQRLGAELKDAQIIYDIEPSADKVGTQLLAGQQNIPLGYELERSSSEREFPERTAYNRIMLAGERGRGVYVKHGINENLFVHAGAWNSLTYNDPQQVEANTFRNLSGTRLAYHAGLKYSTPNYELGLSGFFGYRNGITFTPTGGAAVTTPSGDRRFFYIDGAYIINPQWTVRGEVMIGHDRVPTFSGSGASRRTNMQFGTVRGNHLQVSYMPNYRNTVSARIEFFDPNTGVNDNTQAWGLAWSYMFNPGLRLTFAHEVFKEQGIDVKNNQTTIRLQVRF